MRAPRRAMYPKVCTAEEKDEFVNDFLSIEENQEIYMIGLKMYEDYKNKHGKKAQAKGCDIPSDCIVAFEPKMKVEECKGKRRVSRRRVVIFWPKKTYESSLEDGGYGVKANHRSK